MTQYTRVPLRRDRKNRRPALPNWALAAIAGGFLVLTFFSAYLVFNTVRNVVAGWKITGDGLATPAAVAGTSGPGPQGTPGSATADPDTTPAPDATAVPTVDVEAWTSTDRVMILVLGIDRRAGEDERGYLTDTMLLVGIDPATRSAAMLSIPRDLWVTIPGFEENTINTANRQGDYYDYPGGGAALAVKTVEYNLGVTINYYVRLDFTAFETVIDAIGGVDIVNLTDIEDDEYPNGSYGYEPFYLPAGPHHLNGHDALRYARTRHNSTDIDRARRQQEVVMAVRDRVLDLDLLPSLIAQAPRLYQTLNASIQTNLSLDQMVSLALLAQDIPRDQIKSGVIDYTMVTEGTTAEGKDVLIPQRDKIRALRDELFNNVTTVAPVDPEQEQALIAGEAAQIQVLNGAGVEGLACTTEAWLVAQGLSAANCDTADRSDYYSSVIVAYAAKPYTLAWLKRTFNVTTLITGDPANSAYDIQVIVGADWRIPSETP
ncbi:MAG: LCP family protein [Anaerolineales bacterium]|nr:LCP family protein [Anaerolineales bacterium]